MKESKEIDVYLISIYFDQETNGRITSYMKRIADTSGNRLMTDGDMPPHITISSFDAKREENARLTLQKIEGKLKDGEIFFASVGSFMTGALFLAPVLNEYLQRLQELCYQSLVEEKDLKISRQYRPYSWFPHATLVKKLSGDEMVNAFACLHTDFLPFHARVEAVGLAKTNPYREIYRISLK
ncbi:MAG: 2'-5' RNA ligase family protein [Dorea sp.]|nr:2'-5' RNA ligase family protein [Dorea sp.]